MQIFQIIQGLYIPSAGPTYSVAKLSDELCTLGENSTVLTQGVPPSAWPYNTPLKIYDGLIERKTGVSYGLMNELKSLMKSECIIHGNGIWRPSTLFPLMSKKMQPAKIVWSPRGTLSEWSMGYKKRIKRPFWKLLQEPALKRCQCFHATSSIEYEDIRRLGFTAPVAIIPNGIDIPKNFSSVPRKRQVVFLSRINPVKGLDLLLPAWKTVSKNFEGWELIIAGPLDNDYARSIKALAHKLNISGIKFIGETLGQAKDKLLSESSLFVLPSYSENFGIAVVEALAHGIPVITTTGTPWKDLEQKQCGWCIDIDQNSLENALQEAMNQSPLLLEQMGQNGRDWMRTDYSWSHVAKMMQQTYEWLLNGKPKPDWVIEE